MENIAILREGDKVIITVNDLTKRLHPSKTGKTMIVATTDGAAKVPDAPDLGFTFIMWAKPGKNGGGDAENPTIS